METKNILCCINGFKPSEAVIDYGCWLSKTTKTTLKLFHAIDTQNYKNDADLSGSIGFGASEELLKEFVETEHLQNKLLQRRGGLILDGASQRANSNGVVDVDKCLRKGKVTENILDLKDKTYIVVLGKYGERHQHYQGNAAVGHKVESIVRSLEKPILIVTEEFKEPKSVCLAFDGSEGAKKALNFVLQDISLKKLDIHLVYVGDESEHLRSEFKMAEDQMTKASINFKAAFLQGEVSETLNQYVQANGISVLAMGAFGHSWLRDMVMGSVTSKLIGSIRNPLLLVR
jgi:nucleotide-binding universal stress UspA family protein